MSEMEIFKNHVKVSSIMKADEYTKTLEGKVAYQKMESMLQKLKRAIDRKEDMISVLFLEYENAVNNYFMLSNAYIYENAFKEGLAYRAGGKS